MSDYNVFLDSIKELPPDEIHQELLKYLIKDPVTVFFEMRERLRRNGIFAEFPEYAPVIHFLKINLHSPEINALCESNNIFTNLRRHADLALWHVSQSESWYPYISVLKAIYFSLQFFDIYERNKDTSLNESVPLYHEFRYYYYFDKILELSSKGEMVIFPTYLSLGATPFINTRGPPIFIIGVNLGVSHVDEFIQTPAEFFIHDINHSRRLYQNSVLAYEKYGYKDRMSLDDYYVMQYRFVQEKLRPLYTVVKSNNETTRDLKQATKIILFEALHEDAEPPLPELLCELILRKPGVPTSFQIIVNENEKKTKNIRKVIIPGGGLLAFVKYKLRYGFMDPVKKPNGTSGLDTRIASRTARTTDVIAQAAQNLLTSIGCKSIPTIDELKLLTDDMTGQNPPVHPNHLGEAINVSKFTGVRPPPLPVDFFERQYATPNGRILVPWTGITKIVPSFEELNLNYKENIAGAKGGRGHRNSTLRRKYRKMRKTRKHHK